MADPYFRPGCLVVLMETAAENLKPGEFFFKFAEINASCFIVNFIHFTSDIVGVFLGVGSWD